MLPKHTNPIPRIFVPSYILAKNGDYSQEGFRNRKDSGYYREVILHDIIKPSESQPNISFLIEDVNKDPLGRYVEGVYDFNPFDPRYNHAIHNPLGMIIIADSTNYFKDNINQSQWHQVLVKDKNGNFYNHGNGRTNIETNCYIVPLMKHTDSNPRIVINSLVYDFLKRVAAQNKTAKHFHQGTKTLFSEQNVPDEIGRHIGSFTGINDTLYKKLLDEDAAKAAKAKAEATAASKGGKRKSRKQKKTRKTRRNH